MIKWNYLFGRSGLLLLMLFVLVGCIEFVEGVHVLTAHVEQNQIMDIYSYQYITLNLDTWPDYLYEDDSLIEIDNIGFQIWVSNNQDSACSFDILASEGIGKLPRTDAGVRDRCILVFDGPSIPANKQTYIDWPTSMPYVRHSGSFADLIISEYFDIFILAENPADDLAIDSFTLIVNGLVEYHLGSPSDYRR